MITADDFSVLKKAIIKQAIIDWNKILRGRNVPKESLISIIRFFESEWGQMICEDYGANIILDKLMKQIKEGTYL